MDATSPMSADLQRQQDRKRKRKAILAGGVVLGLGAAVTLAAWSDDVFADGVFNTGGIFILEGSKDAIGAAGNFAQAQEANDAIRLVFSAEESTALTPGDTAYAPFNIRLTAESTLDGTLDNVTATATGPMTPALEYTITSDVTGCDETGGPAGGADWVTNQAVASGTPAGTTPLDLTANVAGTAGDVVPLCVAVTFPDTLEARQSVGTNPVGDTTVVWDFFGEQAD